MSGLKHWAIALAIAGLDQKIKNNIENRPAKAFSEWPIGKSLLIRRYHNEGMMLNLGENHRPLVASLSLVLTVVLAVGVCTANNNRSSLKIGQTLMLGGALSNTYDRLKRKYVVDYVSFNLPVKRLRAIVFNIADFAIIFGAVLVAISTFGKSEEGGTIGNR